MAEVSADNIVLGYGGTDPYLVFIEATIYDTAGNNNSRLDPGETVDLTVTLLNIGGADLTNLSTTLETPSSYINIIDNNGYFGNLPVDSIKENTSDPYVVSASSSTPHGHHTEFNLIATADGGFIDTIDFSICVGQDVPSDTGYYYVYYSGGVHTASPSFEWIAIDSTQTVNPGISLDLVDNQTVTVDLPFTFTYYGQNYSQISICSNGWIAMGSQTDTDWSNSSIPNADGPQAMIAGLWDDLDPGNTGAPSDIYHYYDEANHRFIIEYFQVEHYPSGNHETFEIILYDPAYYSTPTGDGEIYVQYLVAMQQGYNTLGIENYSENVGIQYFLNNVYDDWAVPVTDEFTLRYTTWAPDQFGIEEDRRDIPSLAQNKLMIHPSITTGHVNICYTITNPYSHAVIKMYDATGRLVKQFDYVTIRQSDHISLDVSHLPAGIYFVHLETDNHRITEKVILID